MENKKYRLVTRSDMDGLVCAVLLKELNIINDILFVHPKDMQDGKIVITSNDITTNLPYVEGVYLAFDHHLSETIRTGKHDNHIIIPSAPSAARVVYEYYGGKHRFPDISDEMMLAVDKADAAQFSIEDILEPKGWELLSFLMDSRTGLGRFREFTISNYQLMMKLIDYCKSHTIEEILALPDVKERVDLYFECTSKFDEQVKRCAKIYGEVMVLDLMNEETIWPGNRFYIYAMYPNVSISIHKMWGFQKQNIVFAVGGSIFKRDYKTNIGELMLKYGGGGHKAAGTCQIPEDDANIILKEIINTINSNEFYPNHKNITNIESLVGKFVNFSLVKNLSFSSQDHYGAKILSQTEFNTTFFIVENDEDDIIHFQKGKLTVIPNNQIIVSYSLKEEQRLIELYNKIEKELID